MQVQVTVKYNFSTYDQVIAAIGSDYIENFTRQGWVNPSQTISIPNATPVDGIITLVRTFTKQKALNDYLAKLDALDPSIKPISLEQKIVD